MSDLKTLKDLPLCDADSLCAYEKIHVKDLKAEAVKVFQAHRNEDLEDATLFWRFLTFFNLTEEDLV